MLDFAMSHENDLMRLIRKTWLRPEYKFYYQGSYYEELEIDESTWGSIQMVCSGQYGVVIGYLEATINRDSNKVSNISLVRFNNDKDYSIVWAKDVSTFLENLFKIHKFRKIEFYVIVGNPIEQQYDRFVKKHNGRIIGVSKEAIKLWDGKYYDKKMYEIMRPENI